MIAEVFLHKISSGKNLIVRGPAGGPQSGTAKFFFELVFKNTLIADRTWMISIFFFVKQISDNLPSVGYMRLPITTPSNKP